MKSHSLVICCLVLCPRVWDKVDHKGSRSRVAGLHCKRHLRTQPPEIRIFRIHIPKPNIHRLTRVLVRITGVLAKSKSYVGVNRGFARRPCCMAGIIDSFSYGKKCSVLCKIIHGSCHATWLPCKTSL